MELKEFIESATTDIIEAISELKGKYNVNYIESDYERNPISPLQQTYNDNLSHSIDFDIAVTTSENSNSKTGGKLGIKIINANVGGEQNYTNENSSRIKFSIPFYPEFIAKKVKEPNS